MNRVAVIGGGPAGLMAAGQAALRGCQVRLFERNPRCGRKLMITGKGRCNLTNATFDLQDLIAQIPTNGRFLYSAFSAFMPYDTIDFFECRGVPIKIERGGRVFPVSDKAVDVVDAMVTFAEQSGVLLIHNRVSSLKKIENNVFWIETENGAAYQADGVILATGGKSYPATGSTGDGYRFAQQMGHSLIAPKPSLVALNCHEHWCSSLQGLSLKNAAIQVREQADEKIIYSDFGEMLFTHYGVSGPMILSASAHLRELGQKQYRLLIDLKPALSENQLEKRLIREFTEQANRDFINALGALLPHKMVPVMVQLSGIQPSLKCNQITKEMRQKLIGLLKRLELTLTSFRPIDEAIVTSGGIPVNEINPKTMESRLCPNLYFSGEMIDVDGYTGGFNLQIAFATGYLAGQKILEESII